MSAWTKLDAVNRVLRAGGENPVSTLASTSGDALMAEAIVDEINLEQQLAGLACNTETVDLTPDAAGLVAVSSNVLHVQVLTQYSQNLGSDFITVRGTPPFLYNVTDNTNIFTVGDTIRARLVYGLAFDDLPFAQQVSIADEAGRRYQMLTTGDRSSDAMLREVFLQSRMRARAQDIRSRNVSIFGSWTSRLPFWAAKRTQRSRWR